MKSGTPLLHVRGLCKHYAGSRSGDIIHAVNGISFDLYPGETVGLVGESGSGKSTIGRLAAKLITPTAGEIWFDGKDVTALNPMQVRPLRSQLQIVFQDPYGALNPRMRIGRLIEEPLRLHTDAGQTARQVRVREIAMQVRLSEDLLGRFPHELSGGQLQRVSIARAIATRPKLIVLDEPTSSLDLSVRAGILDLLLTLQRDTGVAFLFITHDLDTVRWVSHRVLVLYLGMLMEQGSAEEVLSHPAHPYTQSLMSAHLPADPAVALARQILKGEIPSSVHLPAGCVFAPRCPVALSDCRSVRPRLADASPGGHAAACLRVGTHDMQIQ